jgi:hypothetical protein
MELASSPHRRIDRSGSAVESSRQLITSLLSSKPRAAIVVETNDGGEEAALRVAQKPGNSLKNPQEPSFDEPSHGAWQTRCGRCIAERLYTGAAVGAHRQHEKTQPDRQTAERMRGHHHAARQHEQQQNSDLNPAQDPMHAAVMQQLQPNRTAAPPVPKTVV